MNDTNIVNAQELSKYLGRGRIEQIHFEETIASTNRVLKELARDGASEGEVVFANEQTAGRGRLGRSFCSPKDKGLYLSMLLRPDDKAFEMAPLTAWVAVAVANAIEATCGERPKIKWVNDLFINGKKVGGIMTELSVLPDSDKVDFVVVGIGINVCGTKEDFPKELRDIVSTIEEEWKREVSRAKLMAEIIREMDLLSENWQIETERYLEQYREDCITVGRQVRVISANEERTALALSVESDFSILVRYEDGSEEKVQSGEISLKLT